MKDKDKKKLADKLGSGGANRAAIAMINRHKVIEDAANGSYGKPKKSK
jgi:hypothetical protein